MTGPASEGDTHMKLRVAVLSMVLAAAATTAAAETFKFVAIGDMPYGDPAKTYPPFKALIGAINARKPDFTIHVGDIKAGNGACSDAVFQEQLDFMGSFASALVYTPGDNEWTDCHREGAGRFDPLERLARLRAMFFTAPQSLGKAPIALERQGDLMAEHSAFVENARFAKSGVHFVTVHVVGSNNNLEPRDRRAANEFFDRDQANLAWLRDSFAKAGREGAKAVVVAMQADMFEFDFGHFSKDEHLAHSGFRNVAEALLREALAFARPVLLIYGDSHNFRVHTPFRRRAPGLLALEVFGADQMHAVEVTLDTNDPAVFSFRPVWNPDK
jgi:Calcineurin-like phosphoesterase